MFKQHGKIWPEKYVNLRMSYVSSDAKVWVWETYDGRNNRNDHTKAVVRVSFDDAGGYLIVLEATNCADYEDVKSRREQDGENER